MAGMFYKLQEVAEKLGKSEDEVRELVKEGKLREFRDGASLLFKVEEVEALLKATGLGGEEFVIELAPSETTGAELTPDETRVVEEKAVLGETDTSEGSESIGVQGTGGSEYELTEDTMGKTDVVPSAQDELGKIEEDVSLDSFGSGSGLLDLSLQADDTSLGADILDDIYPGEAGDADAAGEMMEAAAEADQILTESGTGTLEEAEEISETVADEAAPARPVHSYAETETASNAFGFVLLVPLVAVVYTAIVAVAGLKGVAPAILTGVTKVPNLIWYIAIGAAVAAGAIMGLATMLSRKGAKTRQSGSAELTVEARA